mmetsp:Transcript_14833/g.21820  ORF Transcript_14833/g.21820 Transcript_14833/m.21820 type:complete len:114 (+) Transcript_14833:311-652(+)
MSFSRYITPNNKKNRKCGKPFHIDDMSKKLNQKKKLTCALPMHAQSEQVTKSLAAVSAQWRLSTRETSSHELHVEGYTGRVRTLQTGPEHASLMSSAFRARSRKLLYNELKGQ